MRYLFTTHFSCILPQNPCARNSENSQPVEVDCNEIYDITIYKAHGRKLITKHKITITMQGEYNLPVSRPPSPSKAIKHQQNNKAVPRFLSGENNNGKPGEM